MPKLVINPNFCKSCGYCVKFCPRKILKIGEEINANGYPYVMQTEPEKPKTVGAELPSSSLTVLFHVKQCAKNLAVLHLRGVRPSDPDIQNRDNADCATESPAKPADLSAHVSAARTQTARGKRHVPPVMSESATAREDRPIHRLQARASQRRLLFPKIQPKIPHRTSPDADNSSFSSTPHSTNH